MCWGRGPRDGLEVGKQNPVGHFKEFGFLSWEQWEALEFLCRRMTWSYLNSWDQYSASLWKLDWRRARLEVGDLIRSQGSHPSKGYLPDRDDETCYQIGCWMERQWRGMPQASVPNSWLGPMGGKWYHSLRPDHQRGRSFGARMMSSVVYPLSWRCMGHPVAVGPGLSQF